MLKNQHLRSYMGDKAESLQKCSQHGHLLNYCFLLLLLLFWLLWQLKVSIDLDAFDGLGEYWLYIPNVCSSSNKDVSLWASLWKSGMAYGASFAIKLYAIFKSVYTIILSYDVTVIQWRHVINSVVVGGGGGGGELTHFSDRGVFWEVHPPPSPRRPPLFIYRPNRIKHTYSYNLR